LILLSSGLLEQLDDREVRGTIAHELGHVTGRHMMLTAGFLATLYFGKTLFGALGLSLTLLLLLVYLAIVRRNEFDADRRGALMVGADVMKQTLARFKAVHGESAWMDRPWLTLLSTHPGFGRRIVALDRNLHGPRRRGESQS
jgi:Zn-dependent protease with chaperone function